MNGNGRGSSANMHYLIAHRKYLLEFNNLYNNFFAKYAKQISNYFEVNIRTRRKKFINEHWHKTRQNIHYLCGSWSSSSQTDSWFCYPNLNIKLNHLTENIFWKLLIHYNIFFLNRLNFLTTYISFSKIVIAMFCACLVLSHWNIKRNKTNLSRQ